MSRLGIVMNKNLTDIQKESAFQKREFIQTVLKGKVTPRTIAPSVSVRPENNIPSALLKYFKIDPRTQQLLTHPEKVLLCQVYLHEIDEGARLLNLARRHEEANMLLNFSNALHPSNRLDLLRSLLEDPKISELPTQRIERCLKARNNQWGAIKTRLGPHPAVAVTELGVGYKERNEDAFLLIPPHKVVALADGMGGHVGGHIASGMAIDFFEYGIHQGMALENAIAFANEAVLLRSRNDIHLGGMRPMGCTFAAIQIKNNLLKVAYVGDTKVLVLRNRSVHFETKDHTQGQQLLEEGLIDNLTAFELNHILNRCLGLDSMRANRDVAVATVTLSSGDRVMVVTDGITDNFFSLDFTLEDLAELAFEGSLSHAGNLIIDSCLSRMLSSSLPNGRPAKCDNLSLAMFEFHA